MEQKTKSECYKQIYQELKKEFGPENLSYPEKREHYEFSCKIGNINVEYVLNANSDLLKIKAVMILKDYSYDKIYELGSKLKEKGNCSFIPEENQLTLQKMFTFAGVEEKEAAKQVHDTAMTFFMFLKENESILYEAEQAEKEEESEQTESKEEEKENDKWLITESNVEHTDTSYSDISNHYQEKFKQIQSGRKEKKSVIENEKKQEQKEEQRQERQQDSLEINANVVHISTQKTEKEEKNSSQLPDTESDRTVFPDLFSQKPKWEKTSDVSKNSAKENPSKENPLFDIKKLYEELDQSFEDRKKQLAFRAATLDQKAAGLKEREVALDKQQNQITKDQESLKAQKEQAEQELQEMKDAAARELESLKQQLNAQIDQERIGIDLQKQELQKEKEKFDSEKRAVAIKKKQLDYERSTLESLKHDVEERADMMSFMPHSESGEELAQLHKQIADYEKKVFYLSQQNEMLKVQKTDQSEKQEIAQLEDALHKSEETLDEMQKTISEYQDSIKEKDREMHQLKMMLENCGKVSDPATLTALYQEQLKELRIDTELVSTDMELILSGRKNDCKVIVNQTLGILYVERPIKRSFKYQKELDKWNQEDIRKSYMQAENKIICKCTFGDALAECTNMIINNLNSLK